MKRFVRFLILIIGLVIAGGLGYKFQSNFEPVMYIIFAVAILIFSEILCQIDKRVSDIIA